MLPNASAHSVYGCELIAQAAIALELSTQVACSAQLLLHRFYCRRSMNEFAVDEVAQTSVFLACKTEECPRKVRDILSVFHWLLQRRAGVEAPLPLLSTTEAFNDRVRRVRNLELVVLNELGYILTAIHPHRFAMCKCIRCMDSN